MNVYTLRDDLRQTGTRMGVGVWLMPGEYLGQEGAIAARLDVHALDFRWAFLQSLPVGARFSGLTRPDGYQNLTHLLRDITQHIHNRDCLLVHNLDLLLLACEVNEREHFWHDVLTGLPYPQTKLILAVPEEASEIFPYFLMRSYSTRIATGLLD